MLWKHIKKHRLFQAALARDMGRHPKTIADYLKRPNIQSNTLMELSIALKHNFFKEISLLLPAEFPPHAEDPKDVELAALRQENQALQRDVETLKEALKLVGGNG